MYTKNTKIHAEEHCSIKDEAAITLSNFLRECNGLPYSEPLYCKLFSCFVFQCTVSCTLVQCITDTFHVLSFSEVLCSALLWCM